MGFVLYGILVHMGNFTLRAGAISGAFCWFGFVLTTVTINNAYCGRKPMLPWSTAPTGSASWSSSGRLSAEWAGKRPTKVIFRPRRDQVDFRTLSCAPAPSHNRLNNEPISARGVLRGRGRKFR